MGWKRNLSWALIPTVAAVIIWLIVNWQAALALVLGAVLSWLPSLKEGLAQRRERKTLEVSVSQAVNELSDLSQAELRAIHRESNVSDFLEQVSGVEILDSEALAKLTEFASSRWYSEKVLTNIPPQSLSMLLLYLMMKRSSKYGKLSSRALRTLIAEDLTF